MTRRDWAKFLLTLNEASSVLGVQPGTLRRQIQLGKLKAEKRGRDWWVTTEEVARYERENRRA